MQTPQTLAGFASSAPVDELLHPLSYPPLSSRGKIKTFGLHAPDKAKEQEVNEIIKNTPSGLLPINIAQSFVDRFFLKDPSIISQSPDPAPWNPLILRFFEATSLHAANDTVPWCAAFLNWCLKRAGYPNTNNASSQSFVHTTFFEVTESPKTGDIVVFTCYSVPDGEDLKIGHVTFFKQAIDKTSFLAIGGNQSGVNPSMICDKTFQTSFSSHRHVGNKYVPVTYKVNRYLSIK